MNELRKLYDAVSQKFDVGTFDEFSAKMGDTESRKRFYDVVTQKGFDVGDYETYEQRLSGGKPKGEKAEVDGESVLTSASTTSSSDSTQAQNNFDFVNPDPEFYAKIHSELGKYKTVRDGSGKVIGYNPDTQSPTYNPVTGKVQIENTPSRKVREDIISRVAKESGVPQDIIDDLDKKNKVGYLKDMRDYLNMMEGEFRGKTADEVIEEMAIDYGVSAQKLKSDVDKAVREMPYFENAGKQLNSRVDADRDFIDIFPNEKDIIEVTDETTLREVYGDLGEYGFDMGDFNMYLESTNPRIKALADKGLLGKKGTTDIASELEMFKNLRRYTIDRLKYMNKFEKSLNYRESNGEDVSTERKQLNDERKAITDGFAKYTKENLSNMVDFMDTQRTKAAREYEQYKKGEGNLAYKVTEEFSQGFFGAAQDLVITLADGFGADDFAEEARLNKTIQDIGESDPLFDMWGTGKSVEYNGNKYLVTDEGQIIDLDTKKNITSITDKVGVNAEELKKLAAQSGQDDSFFSPYNMTVQSGGVFGNLAFQLATTRGLSGVVGTSTKAQKVSSMVSTGAMVYSSTYEDILQQLRDAGVSEQEAVEGANEIAMMTGSVAGLTSAFAYNPKGLSLLYGRDSMKNVVNAAITAQREGGKKAMFKAVKDKTVSILYGSGREGLEESVQENLEYITQQLTSGEVNKRLGQDILEDDIKLKDIIDNSILSFGTSAAMAGVGQMRENTYSPDKLQMYDLLSTDFDKFTKELDYMTTQGLTTEEEATALRNDVEKYLKYSNAIPKSVEQEQIFPMIDLLDERNRLEQRKKTEDKAFHKVINQEIEAVDNKIARLMGVEVEADTKAEPQTLITPENSSNYANMTEDGGDFIFFHEGAQGYETIKPSTGKTATSREEAAALSKVGGVAMYYTDPNATERQSATGARYAVRVPKERVYDFNSDPLNLIEEAEKRHKEEHPDKAFDPNTQVAYVTKIAGEQGFDMVVSEWNGITRAQTTKELQPTDVRTKDGSQLTKDFDNQYQGNTDKGFKSVIPKTKNEALSEAYDAIYKERNKAGVYDKLYHLYTENGKYTQDEITEMVEQSDLSPETKQQYIDAVNMEQETRRSEPLERTNGVQIEGSPEGNYINVGMKSGKTDKDISEAQILKNLPSDVTVEQKGIKTVESDGGTENTLSLKLSRPLTNGEMRKLLENTEQLAIPQLAEGNGVMFGTKDWGDFNPEFFAMPDGQQLNQIINEQNTQVEENTDDNQDNETEGEGSEGTIQTRTNTGTVGNVQDSSREIAKKSKELADKLRKLKVNSSIKKSMSKLNSRPTALFELAWDGAIETAAITLELTGNATQSIYAGLESMRNSEWYKSLSKQGRVKADRKLEESLRREIGEDIEPDTSFLDSMKASFNKGRESLIQKIIDKYYILRQAVGKNFKIVDDSVNFSQAEINMHGKAANDLDKFDAEMRTVIEDIAEKGFTVNQVSDYLYAKHAEERNNHIRENIDPENQFGSGMTKQEADKILNFTYSQDQIKDLEELSEKFGNIIQGTRDIMLDFGLITEEQYNGLVDFYQNYVPLKGFENEEIQGGTEMQGSDVSVSGQVVRRAAGRSTKADNVIANIVSQRVNVTLKARKNEVLQTLYRLAEREPDNGVMKLYTPETLPRKMVVQADGKQVMTPERPNDRKDYVGVKVDGKQYYLKFANEELGRVLNAANIEKTSLVGKTLGALNRYLSTTLTTLDPEFVISNFARDIQTAVFNVMAEADINENLDGENIAKKVVRDTRKSISAIYGNERKGKVDTEFQKFYEEFKEDGAKTGWANQNNLADIKRKLEGIHKMKTAKGLSFTSAKGQAKNLLEFINDVNTSVENGVRLSAYVNARRAGLTRPQAAALAKELTVNFNKSGEWGSLFNSMYLFFNASIQGNVRFIKAMTTLKKTVDAEGNVKRSLNRGQKLALAMTAFAATITMLNQAISDDDEDGQSFYSKIPDYEKERNLIFMNPLNGRDYFKIPLPYGYNIFHNLGTITTEVSTGDRSVGNGIGFLTSATIGAFSPINFGNSDNAANAIINAATPTVAKPIVDLAKNEDFFGSQIYNENLPFGVPKPDSSMGRRTTPEAFKNITEFLNEISGGNEYESGAMDFAPESLYYLFKFGVGGTGKFLTNVGETVGTAVDVAQGQAEEFETRKIPFVRKVYAEPNKYVDQSNYFDRFDKIRQRKAAMEARKKDGKLTDEDRRNFRKVAGVVSTYEEVTKKLKEIRQKKKQVEKLTDPIKRTERLNELDDKYFRLIKKANGVYNKQLGKNYE